MQSLAVWEGLQGQSALSCIGPAVFSSVTPQHWLIKCDAVLHSRMSFIVLGNKGVLSPVDGQLFFVSVFWMQRKAAQGNLEYCTLILIFHKLKIECCFSSGIMCSFWSNALLKDNTVEILCFVWSEWISFNKFKENIKAENLFSLWLCYSVSVL